MAQIFENSYVVNSFYAVDANTQQRITPDSAGKISVQSGQKIVFISPYDNSQVTVNTIVFNPDSDMLIQLNDNGMYPLYIKGGEKKGVQYMMVTSFTTLTSGELYYEGIVS